MKNKNIVSKLSSIISEGTKNVTKKKIFENEGVGLTDEERFDKIMNTQEYVTKEEYDFCVNYAGVDAVESVMSYIGDYSNYGDYLNLNVYSEADKEAHDFAKETGGYGDLDHYAKTGYVNQDTMYDNIDDEEIENLKNQDDEFSNKYIRPHDSQNFNESNGVDGVKTLVKVDIDDYNPGELQVTFNYSDGSDVELYVDAIVEVDIKNETLGDITIKPNASYANSEGGFMLSPEEISKIEDAIWSSFEDDPSKFLEDEEYDEYHDDPDWDMVPGGNDYDPGGLYENKNKNKNKMKKKLTMKEFKSLIREEVQKLQRRTILENEKKALMKEFMSSDEIADKRAEYFTLVKAVEELKEVESMSEFLDVVLSVGLYGQPTSKKELMKSINKNFRGNTRKAVEDYIWRFEGHAFTIGGQLAAVGEPGFGSEFNAYGQEGPNYDEDESGRYVD